MAKRERLNTPNKLRFQKREGLIPFMEIFDRPTIQGEGMVIGQKTIFVRTAFCQYSCSWCFGIPRNYVDGEWGTLDYAIPTVQKRDGSHVKMTEIEVGDEIFTYDENKHLVLTTVKEIMRRNSDDLYEVKFTNSRNQVFFATGDHEFYIDGEWIALRDIENSDSFTITKAGEREKLKKFEAIFSYDQLLKIYSMQDALIAKDSHLVTNNYAEYVNAIELVKSQLGSNSQDRNGNYKADSGQHNFNYLKKAVREGIINKCEVTGITDNLIVHHIDGNDRNDDIHNLIVITRRVHDNVHARGKNFGVELKDGKRSYVSKKKVEQPMETINFRCEPYNTYFANHIYTHNCDSKFTWDGTQQPEWITPLDLKERVLNTITLPDGRRNCDHITLTGGNPGLIGKEMEEFIDLMKAEGFQFSMETQGVNWQDWYTKVDQIVMSPKPPSSGMKTNFRILDKIIDKLNEADANWSLKVVIFDDTDFEYAREVFKRYREVNTKNPFNVSVGNENATEEGDISKRLLAKLEWLWNKVLDDPEFNDVRPLPQLHTLVWANKRGV